MSSGLLIYEVSQEQIMKPLDNVVFNSSRAQSGI